MFFEDSSGLFGFRRERPIIVIPRAAQDYSIPSREHVATAQVTVINLRLRQQHFQLAAHGAQFLIAKKRTGAQARAVEDDRLGKAHDLFTAAELLDHEPPAGDVEVTKKRVEVDRRLDQHRAVLAGVRKTEIKPRVFLNLLL